MTFHSRHFIWQILTVWALTVRLLAAAEIGPPNGSLVIVGGGVMRPDIVREFIDSAGGIDSEFVIIPTANLGEDWGEAYVRRSFLAKAGVTRIKVLHTRDRQLADREDFVAPLKTAKGVWIDGGRQWRLADAYLETRTQTEIAAVLDRGGVVGGSSAGATIQGSYLVRGAPEGNHIMMAEGHETGFGLLKAAAIDQHVSSRKRELDLQPVVKRHPQLLGIGLDEGTAIAVRKNRFHVVGAGHVFLHGERLMLAAELPYLRLSAGDVFDLETRTVAFRQRR